MDNRVDLKYVGWPTRTYLIDKEGRVLFDSGLGPYCLSHDKHAVKMGDYLGSM